MIKRLFVEGLYDRFDFDLQFHEDLNLLTGRNGSGKTTLMKLMWGILSGRIGDAKKYPQLAGIYIEFEDGRFFHGTRERSLKLLARPLLEKNYQYVTKWETVGPSLNESFVLHSTFDPFASLDKHRFSQTLFFPTFRRSEGGYEFLNVPQPYAQQPLEDKNLGTLMRAATKTNGGENVYPYHVFVNYSSTTDIDFLLATLYGSISDQTRTLEKEQAEFIIERTTQSEGNEKAVLQEIRSKQKETNEKVAALMKPITHLSEMIGILYHGKGVKVSQHLTLGDSIEAVHSDQLSSGEKQILSFLAYCSLCKNAIIFIDEPELSLHPDWQRLLVPMLMDIPNGNQYFMATHSPFVYAKYPDKQVRLHQDKGDN